MAGIRGESNLIVYAIIAIVVIIAMNSFNDYRKKFASPALIPESINLLEIARGHVELAEASQSETMLWGRVGGSEAERESARLLAMQLSPWVNVRPPEPVEFEAYRPQHWTLSTTNGISLSSAMPAPFDAKFPISTVAPIHHITQDSDWDAARGKWAFIEADMPYAPSATSVRQDLLYQKAIDHGAAGFLFSLPHPEGDWKTVVPVDKPFTKRDTFFPDHIRPIPSFCISSDDAKLLLQSLESETALTSTIEYHPETSQKALNTIAKLNNDSDKTVLIAAHLDSFFSGAVDDASGIAVLVGLAHALANMPEESRKTNFIFAGIAAHHDEGAGIRAFVAEEPDRLDSIETFILLEHLDAHHGDDAGKSDWPETLNDQRSVYIGPNGWPGVEPHLNTLVQESDLMAELTTITHACVADLFVTCDQLQSFTLIQGPPYYHTNHDTIDKLTEQGLQNAVQFHLHLLETAGYISRSHSESARE